MSTVIESHPNDVADAQVSAADRARTNDARQRYLSAFNDLLLESSDNQTLVAFADALSWTLARLIDAYGVFAVGDVLRRVGGYIGELAERRRVEAEAEQARREGREPT